MNRSIFFLLFFLFSLVCLSQNSVKLYVHVIQYGNSSQVSANQTKVDGMLCNLSTDFNGVMSFSWDGVIQYINDPYVYTTPLLLTATYMEANFNIPNGVNIYIYGDDEHQAVAGGIGFGDYILIGSGERDNTPIHQTRLLTHEMGHIFNLNHVTNDITNIMCDACSGGSITDWDHFTGAQKNIMIANLSGRGNLTTSNPGQDLCPPPPCPSPNANNISISTVPFGFGNWWVTHATYNGANLTWEWELLSNNMWGAGGGSNWIMWEDSGYGVDLRVRVTNSCGSTSGWKEYTRN